MLLDTDFAFDGIHIMDSSSTTTKTTTTETAESNSLRNNDQTVESLLAQELNKLSFHERETIHDEIHGIGVGAADAETPERLARSLRDLQGELETLCNNDINNNNNDAYHQDVNTSAFRRRTTLKQTYLDSDDFRAMFLRCERFDCKKAAVRLCGYAETIYDLFGDIGLERKIQLSDLPDEELEVMKGGHCQILGDRDRAGRKVFVYFYSNAIDSMPPEPKLRICLRYFMSMVEGDVDTQARGVVLVFWMHNYQINIDEFARKAFVQDRISKTFPFRIGAFHQLFPTPSSTLVGRIGSLALAKIISRFATSIKHTVRIHVGML